MKKVLICIAVLLIAAAAVAFNFREQIEKKFIYPRPYSEIVAREAEEFDLPENLIYAVMKAESGFDENAESHAGAKGLMQLTPQTFEWIASLYPGESGEADIMNPSDNIHCGCALLRLLIDRYGLTDEALCAYNAGIGTVDEWLASSEYSDDGEVLDTIPYSETSSYVKRVRKNLQRYEELYAEEESSLSFGI